MKTFDIEGQNDNFTPLFILQIFPEDLLCVGSHGFHRVEAPTLLERPFLPSVLGFHINEIAPYIITFLAFFLFFSFLLGIMFLRLFGVARISQ